MLNLLHFIESVLVTINPALHECLEISNADESSAFDLADALGRVFGPSL